MYDLGSKRRLKLFEEHFFSPVFFMGSIKHHTPQKVLFSINGYFSFYFCYCKQFIISSHQSSIISQLANMKNFIEYFESILIEIDLWKTFPERFLKVLGIFNLVTT